MCKGSPIGSQNQKPVLVLFLLFLLLCFCVCMWGGVFPSVKKETAVKIPCFMRLPG